MERSVDASSGDGPYRTNEYKNSAPVYCEDCMFFTTSRGGSYVCAAKPAKSPNHYIYRTYCLCSTVNPSGQCKKFALKASSSREETVGN